MEPAPKKVLYVITKATWGGAQRYVFDLIKNARDAGYEPLLAYGEPGVLTERVKTLGVPVYEIPGLSRNISLTNEFRALGELTKLLRTVHPDILHINSSKAGTLGVIAAKWVGIPHTIFTAHGWAFMESRSFFAKLFFLLAHAITVLGADTVVAVSEAVAKKTPGKLFCRRKITTIYNGVSSENTFSKEAARTVLIARDPTLAKSKSELWVGTIGELHKNKGLDVGITAWKELKNSSVPWVIIGEGEDRAKLVALGASTPAIHFLGFMEDAARYLPAFDIFLLPSRTEALAYVVLEAGLAGIPVVATRVGGIPEIVRNENEGVLVAPNDASALQDGIEKMIADETRRTLCQTALQKHVLADFSLSRMLTSTYALYR